MSSSHVTTALLALALGAFVREPAAPALSAEQAEVLEHLSIAYLDDGQGNALKTLRIHGVNVQLVNGLRATNGHAADPLSVDPGVVRTNGLGNLIIGYNEPAFLFTERTGSHNLVVGKQHSWSSVGGLLAGDNSTVSAPYASVTGGQGNHASGAFSTCHGGLLNEATGEHATCSAGSYNIASGMRTTTCGGAYNIASGAYATCSGGEQNTADGINAVVSGGNANFATGNLASVSGGSSNRAEGYAAGVSGGENNTARGEFSAVLGGSQNLAGGSLPDEGGDYATVSGGQYGVASGAYASVSGGGGPDETDGNWADGDWSAVSGGRARGALDEADWAAGGQFEDS